jgi:DNA-binding NarL/FixJ family response regulator
MSVSAIRVMLVDDHAIVREGYRRLLAGETDLRVVGEHGDAESALRAMQRDPTGVDVMVLDLSLPGRGGIDLLRRCLAHWPQLRVLVFTMHDAPALVAQVLRTGACGFVTKHSDPAFLVEAIRRVAAGSTVVSPDVHRAGSAAGEPPHAGLSTREFEVLHGLVKGLTAEEIATRLSLSPKTVANHQSSIRAKLGVHNGVALLRYAQTHGLFEDERAPDH